MPSVAIIGAGMAGLAAARRLGERGIACTLFDKGRSPGGRMATRRMDNMPFDHGAQFFTARGPRFRALADEWLADGTAEPWFGEALVGSPGMSAPARALAAEQTVILECAVTELSRTGEGWTIRSADGAVETAGNGSFSAVVLAVPAPQVTPLAGSAGVRFAAVDTVRYAPCWTMMLAFDAPLALPADHLRPPAGPLAWLALNSNKPGRPDEPATVVAHATPEWSRNNLELSAAEVAAFLSAEILNLLPPIGAPSLAVAHRWRYALVEQSAGAPCLWDSAARLGACGDWCLGPRVEAAFDSGEAMAAMAALSLGTPFAG